MEFPIIFGASNNSKKSLTGALKSHPKLPNALRDPHQIRQHHRGLAEHDKATDFHGLGPGAMLAHSAQTPIHKITLGTEVPLKREP